MTGDCMIWQGAVQSRGYGSLTNGKGGSMLAHRAVWEATYGAIPDGMTIDHLCRTKLCVNVAHMEVVSRAENTRRAHPKVTHCHRGHEYTDENTYLKPAAWGFSRQCRKCGAARNRARRMAAKAVAA